MKKTTICSAGLVLMAASLWLILTSSQAAVQSPNQSTEAPQRYLKLDRQGRPVQPKQGPWHCIVDTATGLIWEVKSAQEDIHYHKSMYSWFNGRLGSENAGTCHAGTELYGCDSFDLVEVSRRQNYCGQTNWRLPSSDELQSILYRQFHPGRAQTNHWLFPRTYRGPYWTAESDGYQSDSMQVTTVHFASGQTASLATTKVAALRLVANINSD